MVLGFALCTTMAFAQTAKTVVSRHDIPRGREQKINLSEVQKADVDYKASIFAKDSHLDTLRVFRFSASDWAEMTVGTLSATDVINVNGTDSTVGADAHTVNTSANQWAQWRRYADSATFKANIMTDYPTWVGSFYCGDGNGGTDFGWVLNRIGAGNNTNDAGYADDGFVFYGYDANNNALSVGNINDYIELPEVTRTTSGTPFVVGVNQAYYSFYDQCFLDYKIGNTWYVREINVNGIDCDVNSVASSKVRYVMPFNLVNQTSIKLRIRVSAKKYAAYGYGWFLDNVAVISNNDTESWEFNHSTPIDGLYGMMPEGMSIPITYGIYGRNTNITTLNNAYISIDNAPLNGEFTTVATSAPLTMTAGQFDTDHGMIINERGFMTEDPLTYSSHDWLGNYAHYGQPGLPQGFQGRHLNTQTVGANVYRVRAHGGNLNTLVDSVLYTVSSYIEFEGGNGVDGYRWGRDNGLIPSNSTFKVGYGDGDDHYLDASDRSDHATRRGYMVHVRYTTGNDIPEGWVFRGFEMVPATDGTVAPAEGCILPVVYEEQYVGEGDDQSLSFVDVPCGIDNQLFSVTEADIANLPTTGYRLPSTDGEANYSAINIPFLDQPTLKPNTAYRFCYRLYEDANFHVAAQAWSYKPDANTRASYLNDEATAPYYYQNSPNMPYSVMVYDASGTSTGGSHWIHGWNINNYPMIRPIVGPADEVERVPVVATGCVSDTNSDFGVTVEHGADDACSDEINVAVGSNQSFVIYPKGDHTYITHVYVNGVEAPVYVEGGETPTTNFWLYSGEANVTNSANQVLLAREYYELFFQQIPQNEDGYTITVDYEWYGWDPSVGIDPVAPEAGMILYPNPATSTVKLQVAGVTGTVNCNIIDMSGRVVYNANINAEAETTINVSNMPAGAYFVRITNDTFSKIEKLIIK